MATTSRLPGLFRDLAGGFKQQMFFWGLDVANPGGNLLVRQGFRREQSAGLKGTSHYKLPWQGGLVLSAGSGLSLRPALGPLLCLERWPIRHPGRVALSIPESG